MSDTNLMDLNTKRPVSCVGRRRGYFIIPEMADALRGVLVTGIPAKIVKQWNYSASNKFTIINTLTPTQKYFDEAYRNWALSTPTTEIPVNIFSLAIRYRIGFEVFRYKLTVPPVPQCVFEAPLYTNQVIRPNFCIEMWASQHDPFNSGIDVDTDIYNEPQLIEDQTILTSITKYPTDLRVRDNYSLDEGEDAGDLEIPFVAGSIAIPVDAPAGSPGEDNED